MTKLTLLAAAAVSAVLLSAAGAQASTYDWTYSDGTVSGHGQLTTGAADTTNLAGGFDVTGFTGVLTGVGVPGVGTITGLDASPTGFIIDNVAAPGAGQGEFLDQFGIGFDIGGADWNIWSLGAGNLDRLAGCLNGVCYSYGNRGTFAISAPEPATWAMMLVGFGALGAAMRSRRNVSGAVAA